MEAKETKMLERRLRGLHRRLWLERVLFILLLVPVGTMWLLPRMRATTTAIRVEGRTIAVVADPQTADRVLTAVKKERAGAEPGATFTREVTLLPAGRDAGPIAAERDAAERLRAIVSVQAPRAIIRVDGTPITALPTERQANAALALVKAHYSAHLPTLVEEPRFQQEVAVVVGPAPTDLWCNDARAAAALLIRGRGAVVAEHTVAAGDTFGEIATRHNLSAEELQRLNPGVRPRRLRVGQILRVRPTAGLVTVIARARVRRAPRDLPVPAPRRGPVEVTYENGIPVAATAVVLAPPLDPAPTGPPAPTTKRDAADEPIRPIEGKNGSFVDRQ